MSGIGTSADDNAHVKNPDSELLELDQDDIGDQTEIAPAVIFHFSAMHRTKMEDYRRGNFSLISNVILIEL